MKHFCNFCLTELSQTFLDLGNSPIANNYRTADQLDMSEPYFPLHLYICSSCLLVQLPPSTTKEAIFHRDYAYFSSYSTTWLAHSKNYAKQTIDRFNLTHESLVIEVASNDGYLLQYFKEENVPVLGIDPAESVATATQEKGIPTLVEYFGVTLAQELKASGKQADLMVANNVLAHVPDLNDFVAGFKVALKPYGIATFEFPHILKLIENKAFDTIYHEHYSYFSFPTVEKIFAHHGLTIFDVEELTTHGGSLRIFARHTENNSRPLSDRVEKLKNKYHQASLDTLEGYANFQSQVQLVKRSLLARLIALKNDNKMIAGYGAPAKGNTLLNYCGIRTDFLEYTVDRNPHKQGLYLPGTQIPIKPVEELLKTKPDCILILPWNLKEEIITQLQEVCSWKPLYFTPFSVEALYDISRTPTPRSVSHNL